MQLQDRWYQTEAVQSLFDFFMALPAGQEGNPLVALPGGTGKSIVIALFIERALKEYPQTRILCLTHVKELIEQNAGKLVKRWFNAPLGIYSAGLGQKDTGHPVIFGGVQSVVKCVELLLRWFDIIVIDEAHLVSPKDGTSYFKIINALRTINPNLRVVGLTATDYRMGQGKLIDPIEIDGKQVRMFTDVCYNMTDIEGWQRLIAEGYLCPLVTPARVVNNDPTTELVAILPENKKVAVVNGDFNQKQLEEAVDKDPVTRAALQQVMELGKDRWSWLIFAAGINHAEHIWRMLWKEFNIPTAIYHSKRTKAENDEALRVAKSGEARAIVNVNSLTTGVDHPPWDLCVMMRPTMSASLWVQMLSRFTRPYDMNNPGDVDPAAFPFVKHNALVLDFARNRKRLGTIDDPKIPRKKGEGGGEVPVKICEMCGTYNHTRARNCETCGWEFPFSVDIAQTASTQEIMGVALPVTEYFDVITVIYNLHMPKVTDKRTNPIPSVRVDYTVQGGMLRFTEYLCFEHKGFAKHRAHEWWRQRHWSTPPETTAEALQRISELRRPNRIRVWVNKEPPEVLSYEY